MTHRMIGLSLVAMILLVACVSPTTPLEEASAHYKAHRDYESLSVIYQHLENGMPKEKVMELLGQPDYSPIRGQYYYSSTKEEYSETHGYDVTHGLIIEFRDENRNVTDKLGSFTLGPIGE